MTERSVALGFGVFTDTGGAATCCVDRNATWLRQHGRPGHLTTRGIMHLWTALQASSTKDEWALIEGVTFHDFRHDFMANAIIYYNTLLRPHVAEQKPAAGDEAVALLTGVSPVAWRYLNLTGTFDFSAAAVPIDLAAFAARYSDPDIWRRSLQEDDGEGPEA